jgi:hypothetical protein
MRASIVVLAVIACGGGPEARTVAAGEACTEKLSGLVFQASTCAELQRLVDAENRQNPACSAFFADGGFDVCELYRKRRKDGGLDVDAK